VWDKNFIDEMHPFFGLINELHSHLSEHIQSRLNPNEELIYDKKETRIIVYATSADKDEFGKRMKESIDKSTKRSDSILRLLDRGEKKNSSPKSVTLDRTAGACVASNLVRRRLNCFALPGQL
jgi:MFS superfamily sulfate permease-like transporter